MAEQLATYKRRDQVAVITLNRPEKRNPLSKAMRDAILQHVGSAENDPDVAVIVLRGAGSTFCAGADMSRDDPTREARNSDGLLSYAYYDDVIDFHLALFGAQLPIIASVQGHALGAGLEMTMMCDLTIGAESALFGEPEIRFGSVGAAVIMPWVIGYKRARELLYMGDLIDARTAQSYGLINRVVPDAELERETLRLADRMAIVGRTTLIGAKRAVNHGAETAGLRDALRKGVMVVSLMHVSENERHKEFSRRASSDGIREAIKWMHSQFD